MPRFVRINYDKFTEDEMYSMQWLLTFFVVASFLAGWFISGLVLVLVLFA